MMVIAVMDEVHARVTIEVLREAIDDVNDLVNNALDSNMPTAMSKMRLDSLYDRKGKYEAAVEALREGLRRCSGSG